MNRRQLFRRAFVTVAAASAAAASSEGRQFPENYDASKDLARSDWKPVFLNEHQNETLIALSDVVIPTTETPGAKEALVNRFIDRILAVESRDVQQEFLNALGFLDGESLDRYKAAFVHAGREQQVELLSYLAYPESLETWGEPVNGKDTAHRRFVTLKDWISRAYYSSETGMRELGYDGGPPHGIYSGCAPAKGSGGGKQ